MTTLAHLPDYRLQPPDEELPRDSVYLTCPIHGRFEVEPEEQLRLDAYREEDLREVAPCPQCGEPPLSYEFTSGGNEDAVQIAAAIMALASVNADEPFLRLVRGATVGQLQSALFEFHDEGDSLTLMYLVKRMAGQRGENR